MSCSTMVMFWRLYRPLLRANTVCMCASLVGVQLTISFMHWLHACQPVRHGSCSACKHGLAGQGTPGLIYGPEVDLWSVGIVLFILLGGARLSCIFSLEPVWVQGAMYMWGREMQRRRTIAWS